MNPPRVISVIEVYEQHGDGVNRPIRSVATYYTLDGVYLGEAHDPWSEPCDDEHHDHKAAR